MIPPHVEDAVFEILLLLSQNVCGLRHVADVIDQVPGEKDGVHAFRLRTVQLRIQVFVTEIRPDVSVSHLRKGVAFKSDGQIFDIDIVVLYFFSRISIVSSIDTDAKGNRHSESP